jgi:hypothetical protein
MFTSTRKRKMFGLAQPLDSPGPPRIGMELLNAYEEGGQVQPAKEDTGDEELKFTPPKDLSKVKGAPSSLAQTPAPAAAAPSAEPVSKKQKVSESVSKPKPTETKTDKPDPVESSKPKEEPKKEEQAPAKEDKVTDLPAVDQRTYNSIKDIPITKLTISRSPVKSNIVSVLNVISLGQLKKITNKLGYDKLWHLALKVTLDNGKSYRIEKNQNISIKPYNEYPGTEIFQLAKSKKAITLREMMNASLKKEGTTRFYEYDAFKNNCQMFVTSLLRSSGLLIPPAATFISQNSAAIAKGIPGYVAPAAKALTSFAAKADKLVQKLFGLKIFKDGGLITI